MLIIPKYRTRAKIGMFEISTILVLLVHLFLTYAYASRYVFVNGRFPFAILTTGLFSYLLFKNKKNENKQNYHSLLYEMKKMTTKSSWKGD